jgi:flagellar M-ring protein FliF
VMKQFGKLGAGRLAAMLMVTAALVAFFAFVMLRFSQPTMSLLYSDLSPQDAAQVVRELETRNIRYETRGDGQTILAPKADIPRIRMELASKGMPSGGGVGYEIFDKGDAFSSTSFVQNINHLRALEGELTRTIRALGRVQNARVHLVIPERRLFERDREPPRASIVLKLRGELDAGQVRAIRHLVASAVEGLKPERVSIVDEGGRLLADGAQAEAGMAGAGAEERQTGMERRIKSQVEEIVASVVGSGRARVQVNAQLEMNRVESRSETFDPESRVARSTQSRTETSTSSEPREQGVTVGNELPGAQGQGGAAQNREATNKNEEVTNFEISRTTRTEVLEGGRLKRLSVAVLVDGLYLRAANGETSYQPRSQEDLDRISALVRTAIGFDSQRGDQVEVVNLRFADAPQQIDLKEQTLVQQLLSFTKEDVMRAAELGVIALLTLIVLLTVVRPLLKQVLAPDVQPKQISGGSGGNGSSDNGEPSAGGGMQTLPSVAQGQQMLAPPTGNESPSERMLALAQIRGQIKAQSVEKIGAMVQANPADSVAVIRSWVHDNAQTGP